jgi:hypothetical protein
MVSINNFTRFNQSQFLAGYPGYALRIGAQLFYFLAQKFVFLRQLKDIVFYLVPLFSKMMHIPQTIRPLEGREQPQTDSQGQQKPFSKAAPAD